MQHPIAIASSLEMLKNVLIKDFTHFTDRNSLDNPDAFFPTMGRKAFSETRHKSFAFVFLCAFHAIGRRLGIKAISDDVSSFFLKVIRESHLYGSYDQNEERR